MYLLKYRRITDIDYRYMPLGEDLDEARALLEKRRSEVTYSNYYLVKAVDVDE